MSEYWQAAKDFIPFLPPDEEYRLYYEGEMPIFLTNEDLSGDYLVINQQQFKSMRLSKYRVRDKILYEIDPNKNRDLALVRDDDGEFCTIPNNMCFIAKEGDRYAIREMFNEVSSGGMSMNPSDQ